MAIKIKGVIGYDIIGSEFADKLSKLTGDIEFEIDSPGGSVFHGISIFNAIKNYNRGKKTIHVVGECSSMAAYIMLSGDSPVIFEPNSVVCIHNPWSIAVGDYIYMKKEATLLEDLAKLYANAFVEKGLFKENEIREIMDKETWFIGPEKLKKLGKVLTSDIKEENDITEEIKIAASRERIAEAKTLIQSLKEENIHKIAALLPQNLNIIQTSNIAQKNNCIEEKITTTEGDEKMIKNSEEVKAQAPEIFNEIKKLGVEEERKRVNSLIKFIEIEKDATIKAIADGSNLSDDDFQSAILYARVQKQEIQAMVDSNPPIINPQEETHEPESSNQGKIEAETQEEKDKKTIKAVMALMKNV